MELYMDKDMNWHNDTYYIFLNIIQTFNSYTKQLQILYGIITVRIL